jgi:hypothetical protein
LKKVSIKKFFLKRNFNCVFYLNCFVGTLKDWKRSPESFDQITFNEFLTKVKPKLNPTICEDVSDAKLYKYINAHLVQIDFIPILL